LGCLEATYEESKRLLQRLAARGLRVWKLPMRNPSSRAQYRAASNLMSLEATYEESKLHLHPVPGVQLPESGSYL